MSICEGFENQLEQLIASRSDLISRCNRDRANGDEYSYDCLSLQLLPAQIQEARRQLEACWDAAGVPRGMTTVRGHISFLRVHVAGGYGPDHDHLGGNVVFKLRHVEGDSDADGRAYGIALAGNARYEHAQDGMFDLLRDAFKLQCLVEVDYWAVPGQENVVAWRISLIAPAPQGSTTGGFAMDSIPEAVDPTR